MIFDMQAALKNSYRNFHARGLDYVCLHRRPELTVKLYVLDGDASKLPEVVNPHDHRYQFETVVLNGAMIDHRWERRATGGAVYEAFDYMTPLNGGSGFAHRGEERLGRSESALLREQDVLLTNAAHIHTIQMAADQTLLLLNQFADTSPLGAPSSCWVQKGAPAPDTSGLYDTFSEAQMAETLARVKVDPQHLLDQNAARLRAKGLL